MLMYMLSSYRNRSLLAARNGLVLENSIEQIKNFEKVNEFGKINPEVLNPYRLLILFGLNRAGFQNVQQLKKLTKIKSDGNLASHLRSLEKQGLIKYKRHFVGRRPLTFYQLTDQGNEIFELVIKNMTLFLKTIKEE